MQLRGLAAAAVAAVLGTAILVGGAAPAEAGKRGCPHNGSAKPFKLTTPGGSARVDEKRWVRVPGPRGITCDTTFSGALTDKKGDGLSVQLWAKTRDPSRAWVVAKATRGKTVSFDGRSLADATFLQICTYNLAGPGSKQVRGVDINCSRLG